MSIQLADIDQQCRMLNSYLHDVQRLFLTQSVAKDLDPWLQSKLAQFIKLGNFVALTAVFQVGQRSSSLALSHVKNGIVPGIDVKVDVVAERRVNRCWDGAYDSLECCVPKVRIGLCLKTVYQETTATPISEY